MAGKTASKDRDPLGAFYLACMTAAITLMLLMHWGDLLWD
jgi:hypothetical protein